MITITPGLWGILKSTKSELEKVLIDSDFKVELGINEEDAIYLSMGNSMRDSLLFSATPTSLFGQKVHEINFIGLPTTPFMHVDNVKLAQIIRRLQHQL